MKYLILLLTLSCVLNCEASSSSEVDKCFKTKTNQEMGECFERLEKMPSKIDADQAVVGCLYKTDSEEVDTCLDFFNIDKKTMKHKTTSGGV